VVVPARQVDQDRPPAPADGVDSLGDRDRQRFHDSGARLFHVALLDVRGGQVEPGERPALHVGGAAQGQHVGQRLAGGLGLAEKQVAGALEAREPRDVKEVRARRVLARRAACEGMLGSLKCVGAALGVPQAGVGFGLQRGQPCQAGGAELPAADLLGRLDSRSASPASPL
jgi:hypothetical protein